MIVGKQKPLAEIGERLEGIGSVLVLGCGECVTVCHAGGQREVDILARKLAMGAVRGGGMLRVERLVVQRQCDPEFIEAIGDSIRAVEAVVTLGCGAGAQMLSEMYPEVRVIPGLNTRFIGAHTDKLQWEEKCSGCGNCMIFEFGGYCPITRCAKSLLNGPCGGSRDGRCEIDPDVPCVWQMIIDRMTEVGRLDELLAYRVPKDWHTSRTGGPRKQRIEGEAAH